jgi:hypothetical protein
MWWTNAARTCTLPRPMARTTAHTDVLMPVLTGMTPWFGAKAGERPQARINQPSGY